VGAVLTDEQLLRALIIMLLTEAMQKDDKDSEPLAALGFVGVLGISSHASVSSYSSIETATNLSQASHQSMPLDSSQAVQSLAAGSGGQTAQSQINVTG
jgi:hypothetical protein